MNVKQVVDKILEASQVPVLEKTCDQLMAGSWDAEVTGIVTSFMATADVIKGAAEQGANLIITHEPTYFTAVDDTAWLADNAVYQAKKKLIDETGMNIWRFHDHMHMHRPDLIFEGLNKDLGWGDYAVKDEFCVYQIPSMTVTELADYMKEKLDVKMARIVGDPNGKAERLSLMLMGGGGIGFGNEDMIMKAIDDQSIDVYICGDITEWTLAAYIRDAEQLGIQKAMIVLGHNRTEEAGMKHLPTWLKRFLPADLPITFIESGEPFSYR